MAVNNRDIRVNKQIRASEVFVINSDGTQLGVMNFFRALDEAANQGLDLVEISPGANPPVCKIVDYGKYRYELEKRQKEAKKNQVVTKLKEVRMQVKVDIGDLNTKARFISEFIQDKNKVKVSVRFRGREMQHPEIGNEVLNKVLKRLDETGCEYNIEKPAVMEGRMMSMLLSPVKKK